MGMRDTILSKISILDMWNRQMLACMHMYKYAQSCVREREQQGDCMDCQGCLLPGHHSG